MFQVAIRTELPACLSLVISVNAQSSCIPDKADNM